MTANHPEDLVARLKARRENVWDGRSQDHSWEPDVLCNEAAALITSLVGERDALRTALARRELNDDAELRGLPLPYPELLPCALPTPEPK